MNTPWMEIWKWVFLAGTGLFALLAVWVAVQGGRDLRSLFRDLGKPGRPRRR